MYLKMQYLLYFQEIKIFIQLIRKTFPKVQPEHIVISTCTYLGLHDQGETRENSVLHPSFKNYPQGDAHHSQKQSCIFQDSGYSSLVETQLIGREPRRRGRPPKTYQQEKLEERVKLQRDSEQLIRPQVSKQDKERRFAQILIEDGYGISVAKKLVNFEFEQNFYYNSLRSILINSFKKLQQKVRTQCKVQIMVSEQHKTIKFKTQLCTFQKWLSPDEAQTFKEYIKSVYNLNPQPVSKGKTLRLYNNILQRWEKAKHLDGRYKQPTQRDES